MRRTQQEHLSRLVARTQRDVLRDVMLSARECGAWLTLQELSRLTRYGEASISAQLRHLKKPCNGGFQLEKRRRKDEEFQCAAERGKLWEYRLNPHVRRSWPRDWSRKLAARARLPQALQSLVN